MPPIFFSNASLLLLRTRIGMRARSIVFNFIFIFCAGIKIALPYAFVYYLKVFVILTNLIFLFLSIELVLVLQDYPATTLSQFNGIIDFFNVIWRRYYLFIFKETQDSFLNSEQFKFYKDISFIYLTEFRNWIRFKHSADEFSFIALKKKCSFLDKNKLHF